MNIDQASEDCFDRDIARHSLAVLRDEGVYRHLRFSRPESSTMRFDILTWPGCLCYTGDMGTYVFERTHDMLKFFRPRLFGPDRPARDHIDLRYWAEKLQATDKHADAFEFSLEQFREEVLDYVLSRTEDRDEWTPARLAALNAAIKEQILDDVEDEPSAWVALREFSFSDEHGQFAIEDWERDCKRPTVRFIWCCLALDWAVRQYDAQCDAQRAAPARPRMA